MNIKFTYNIISYANLATMPYELPDGNTIEVGADRYAVPELLFNPEPLNVCFYTFNSNLIFFPFLFLPFVAFIYFNFFYQ